MKTKVLVALMAVFFLVACKKGGFDTTPTLTLKSVGNKVVSQGGFLRVEFEITDKEGDISDTLYFKKIRLNKRTTATVRDSLAFSIPSAPKTTDGFIELNLQYQNHLISAISPGNPRQNDTLNLQFTVRDKAKNRSTPVTVENVIVIR
jgi:hypothetical protein